MKVFFSKSVKNLPALFIIMFLIVYILINLVGYLFDLEYISVFAAAAQVDKYEVRGNLLMDAMSHVGVCRPEDAAKLWAEGLKSRSAAMQYAAMTQELKDEYAKQLENSFPNWVTGVSSPWIDSYDIVETEIRDKNTYIFKIRFDTKTSTGPAGIYHSAITVIKDNNFWRISGIDADKELYVYTGFQI